MERTHRKHKSQKKKNKQEEQQQKTQPTETETETVHLLEDGWFFGNSLNSTPKMVRCFSEPAPSSAKRTTEMFAGGSGTASSSSSSSLSKMGGGGDLLQRAPSLPPNIWREREDDWKDTHEEEVEEDEDEPRMGDLIRQATMPKRQLSRLPLVRREPAQGVVNGGDGQLKGPVGKLTRRASLDPSLLLPPCPKHASSKGFKQGSPKSSSPSCRGKNQQHSQEMSINAGGSNSAGSTPTHPKAAASLRRTMSLTLSHQEVRGFRELGFSFDNNDFTAGVVNGISCLEIKESEEEEEEEEQEVTTNKNNHPSMSEAWNATRRTTTTNTIPKWTLDSKASSSAEDMKAQIKFWARAVASNMR